MKHHQPFDQPSTVDETSPPSINDRFTVTCALVLHCSLTKKKKRFLIVRLDDDKNPDYLLLGRLITNGDFPLCSS